MGDTYKFPRFGSEQNGSHFADILKCICFNENVWISIKK